MNMNAVFCIGFPKYCVLQVKMAVAEGTAIKPPPPPPRPPKLPSRAKLNPFPCITLIKSLDYSSCIPAHTVNTSTLVHLETRDLQKDLNERLPKLTGG